MAQELCLLERGEGGEGGGLHAGGIGLVLRPLGELVGLVHRVFGAGFEEGGNVGGGCGGGHGGGNCELRYRGPLGAVRALRPATE